MKQIEGRLELQPESWGEVIRTSTALRTKYFRRVHDDIVVEYAVHDNQPIVFVLDVFVNPGHPLADCN